MTSPTRQFREVDALINAVAAAFSLYLLSTSLAFLPFAVVSFILVVVMSVVMAGILAITEALNTGRGISFLFDWLTHLTLLDQVALYSIVLLMALALAAGPVVLFMTCLRKRWVRLAIIAAACAAMQFFALEVIAARGEREPAARPASEQLQSTNLYPFIKSGVYVYLAFLGFAALRIGWGQLASRPQDPANKG